MTRNRHDTATVPAAWGARSRGALRGLFLALSMVLLLGAAAAPGAMADELDDARAAGYLGERPDGYLGQVSEAPPSVVNLMREINNKRREQYEQIAAKNQTSVEAVQAIVADKIKARIEPGWYYMDASGNWQKK